MQDNSATGQTIRQARESLNKGLRQAAREAGVDPAHLSRIERGLQMPSVDVLARVAAAVGLEELARELGAALGSPAPESEAVAS